MKAVVTGASGTVGRALVAYLTSKNVQVIAWDRSQTPIDDYSIMETYLSEVSPDVVYHLAVPSKSSGIENEAWLVNYHWSSEIAWITRILSIKFVYVSTVMVFSNDHNGPFTVDSMPDAPSGYGYDKRIAEKRVFHQNPDAFVVRLGWQIGDAPGSNNMIDYFTKQMKLHGEVRASKKWLPSCSFLGDTAIALGEITTETNGLYLINSNYRWNYFQIASALNERHGNLWKITATDDFDYDQRMVDARVKLPKLEESLPELNHYE